eukprot:TRINITY_DN52135_c0_g1_i5.p1 TRINITY_DN52135_c0_g1~~TRINITY_DN52135_c0_g1_i5.p1  ORF type:complete len:118 (-),score=19.72 TRINITY_DN52135_c0_g1_i5:29-382(-)
MKFSEKGIPKDRVRLIRRAGDIRAGTAALILPGETIPSEDMTKTCDQLDFPLFELIDFLVDIREPGKTFKNWDPNHMVLMLRVFDPKRSETVLKKLGEIGRAVQQECRDRSRMPSSA